MKITAAPNAQYIFSTKGRPCGLGTCVRQTTLHCRVCARPICGEHCAREALNPSQAVDICTDCYCDAATIVAKSGTDPTTFAATNTEIAMLAWRPQFSAPKGLSLEQAERYERELWGDPAMLAKALAICRSMCRPANAAPGTAIPCCLESGHEGEHKSQSGVRWIGGLPVAEAKAFTATEALKAEVVAAVKEGTA